MLDLIRSRLQYKLMLGFSAVLLGALALIALHNYLSTRDVLIAHARDDQMRLARTRVLAVERQLAEIDADLLFLAHDPTILSYANDDLGRVSARDVGERLIGLLSHTGTGYLGICLTDPANSHLICARVQDGQPRLVEPVASYTPPVEAQKPLVIGEFDTALPVLLSILTVSPPDQPDRLTPVLRYHATLLNKSRRVRGQIILDVAAQPIFDLLVEPLDSTRTIIVNQDGEYLFGADAGNLRHDRPASAGDILALPQGMIVEPSDGLGLVTTYSELRFPGESAPIWVVIYDQPVERILASINQVLLVSIGLALGLLLMGLLMTYALTGSIVRPVRALAAAAERVAAGDLLTPIRIDSRDEIGALAHTLDRTVARLRTTLDSAESRRREAETLYSTVIALSLTLDLHRLLDRILEELRAVVPYDSSTVQLVRGDYVEIIGAYGLACPEKLIGTAFPLTGSGPNAEVARQRTTVILDDAPKVYVRFNEEPYRADPIRSWLGVPLVFGERLIGMIAIDKYEPGFYTAEHARIASAFAAQAAIALENARLYEAVRDELAERRRSEQAQIRLAAILEATTDVVGSADTSGRMLFLNRAGRRLLGIDEHTDVIGVPIHDYVPADTLHQILNTAVPIAIRDGLWAGEIMMRRSDGSEMPASQVVIAHRDSEGQPEYFSTIVRDISERLRAEEQLRQAQKMEAVGRLAGGVSHDFNNILTVIMGECDLMLHEPGLSAELRQGLDQIRQAGARAAALTRQLLAFSRRQVLQPATINLNEIIVPIEQMLRRLIGEDVTLLTSLADHLASVRADPSQIEQVILNLCINGRDAMPNGGDLYIITENICIVPGDNRDLRPGDYVLLTVRDAGSGIDEATREHIFEPFFTTKPRGKGTGLGLATVHGIVQQSGGVIRFESTPGQGTRFCVYLPAVAPQRSPVARAPGASPAFANFVVLLVEDDERVRRLTHQILVSQGLTVIEAADGSAALRASERHHGRIDLLLSDIVMPGGLNGAQLAARVRVDHPQIKVLLMSGYTDDALVSTSGVSRDIHFIQKPFTPAYLIERIAQLLGPGSEKTVQRGA